MALLLPPRVVSITPEDGTQDVVLDIEDPLTVVFASSVKQWFIDFRLDPPVELAFENNEEKNVFRVIPKEPLRDGTTYTLSLSYRPRKIDRSEEGTKFFEQRFTTLPAPPTQWSADFALRLAEAKRLTRPKYVAGKYIDINVSSQVMTIFENGKVLESYLISSGKPGMDTPKGEYHIYNKAPRPWSKKYGLYMPYWMALVADGKFGIHELPEWPGGYKEGVSHLGRPVSHGCVRLGVGAAKKVYEWADQGTAVFVY